MTAAPLPLAAYELAPMPVVSDSQIAAIIARHRLSLDGPVEPWASAGAVHALWGLGSQWVLRVPKNEEMCLGDHLCESVAIPLARAAGVRTPAIVAFDDSHEIMPVPYTITERIHGNDLITLRWSDPEFEGVYRAVGEQLAILHSAPVPPIPHPLLRTPDSSPAENFFGATIEAGLLHAEAVEWMRLLCERLDAKIESSPAAPRVLVHDDIKPDNLMVDTNGLVHLIDWGDCGYGDPATDFHGLPLRATAAALRGYRAVTTSDQSLESRIVRSVIARSVSGLRRTPRLGPSWYRPIAATVTDLLTFAVDHPDLWHAWTS